MGELGRLDASELLVEAHRVGLKVWQQGDKLKVEGPKRYAELAQALLAAKPAVLAELARGSECSRCEQPGRVVPAYWDESVQLCPTCCAEVAADFDRRDAWPEPDWSDAGEAIA